MPMAGPRFLEKYAATIVDPPDALTSLDATANFVSKAPGGT